MNFKKQVLTIGLILTVILSSQAHYLWIETAPTAKQGKAHQVNVYFGEYTYGLQEETAGDAFGSVSKFKLWAIAPSGKKEELKCSKNELSYSASFTPKEKGTYTIVLNNNEIDVIDYTKYDFGIFKTHYHSTARVVVGKDLEPTQATNNTGLVVINKSTEAARQNGEQSLQIQYQGEALKEGELKVFQADHWAKEMTTDENGMIKFKLPWPSKYIVEVTKKEEVPGSYKGEKYEFIWHCATYCIDLSK